MKKVLAACSLVLLTGCSSFLKQEKFQNEISNVENKCNYFTIDEIKQKLKNKNFNINEVNNNSEALLTIAARKNDLKMVRFLIENGAIPVNNDVNSTPLGECTDLQIIKILLENGSDVNGENGMACVTKLHQAAAHGDFEMVKLLIKYKPNVNKKLSNGDLSTPIQIASKYSNSKKFDDWWGPHRLQKPRYLDVIKLLIENGANVFEKDKYGKNAIIIANEAGNKEIIDFFKRF